MQSLTADERATFDDQGFLVLRGVLDPARLDALRRDVQQLEDWAELDGPGLHHFEATEAGPALARSEDWVPYHQALNKLVCDDVIIALVGQAMGEPAVLYKEKVNYKLPGGAGFAPHQDAPAYRFVDHHVTALVAIDDATEENGCLWFAAGQHTRGVLPHQGGRIDPTVAETFDWKPVPVQAGDVVLFDSYAPHHSGTNHSPASRRALYLTYNAARHGDLRERYYADKRAEFAARGQSFDGERARISVNDDFLGKPAARPARGRARPLEELFAHYASERAHQLYDEEVTELVHGLQCAAIARAEGASDAAVAAALLHDVGHLLIGDWFDLDQELPRDFHHEEVGARYLARWFGPEVTEPVRLHVAAKRYLVATEPSYAGTLTPSSSRSLAVQGGPMSEAECAAFRTLPGWEHAVAVRRWDDLGKDPELEVAPFAAYQPMLARLAR